MVVNRSPLARLRRDVENLLFETTSIPELQRQILTAEIMLLVEGTLVYADPQPQHGVRDDQPNAHAPATTPEDPDARSGTGEEPVENRDSGGCGGPSSGGRPYIVSETIPRYEGQPVSIWTSRIPGETGPHDLEETAHLQDPRYSRVYWVVPVVLRERVGDDQ